jgi:hypothetical protein
MRIKPVYLVAKYYAKPRNPSQTFRAGYLSDEKNVQFDEAVDIVTHLKPKDLSTARIILNITEQKVLKDGFSNGQSFMELFQYFYTNSPQEISRALQAVGITISQPVAEEISTPTEAVQVETEVKE